MISTHGHYTYSCYAVILPLYAYKGVLRTTTEYTLFRGSRNLVGIAIQLSDSEQEKLLVGYSMLISPEKFDFGVE